MFCFLGGTPKHTRKPVMEILPEDSETEEDDEILSLTLEGVSLNKNTSFTNLVTETPSPIGPRSPREGDEQERRRRGNAGEEEERDLFYLQDGEEEAPAPPNLFSSSFKSEEDSAEDVYRTITNQDAPRLAPRRAKSEDSSLHRNLSSCSFASSPSSAYQSFQNSPTHHSSPTDKFGKKCTIN